MLGKKLNLAIGCPVRFPAYDKNVFECKHHVPFPLFVVAGQPPEVLRELHEEKSLTQPR